MPSAAEAEVDLPAEATPFQAAAVGAAIPVVDTATQAVAAVTPVADKAMPDVAIPEGRLVIIVVAGQAIMAAAREPIPAGAATTAAEAVS